MTINFKLGPVIEADPADDPMRRTWVGWSPTHSDQKTYEQNRGLWVLGPRASRERHATFSVDGIVRVVVEIDSLETIPAKHPGSRAKRAIVGRVLAQGDPVYDALIGQQVDGHRNPVSYLADPTGARRGCACGCGGQVPPHRAFLAGHDQRAVHERISRQWGDTLGFIEWFDATFPSAS